MSFEWSNQLSYTLSPANAPCSSVSLTPSVVSPRTVGTTVAFTSVASPCSPPTYQFWVLAPGGAWTIAQAYSASGAFTWNTTGLTPGTYQVAVWARQAGAAAAFEWSNQVSYTLNPASAPCNAVSLVASAAPPKPAGVTVTFTAAASPCSPTVYQFWVLAPGGSWTIAQSYSATATFVWVTGALAPGEYQIAVWAKQSGSAVSFDWSNQIGYKLN